MACRLEQLETATGALRQAGVELDLLGGGCAHMSELSAQHGGMVSTLQALSDYLRTLNTLLGVASGAFELHEVACPGGMAQEASPALSTLAAVASMAERVSVTTQDGTNGSSHDPLHPSQSHSEAVLSVFRFGRDSTLSRCRSRASADACAAAGALYYGHPVTIRAFRSFVF